jgi:hypothetical protein
MKAQTTIYAAFASGSLTVAMLNIAAIALLLGMQALLRRACEGHKKGLIFQPDCKRPCASLSKPLE